MNQRLSEAEGLEADGLRNDRQWHDIAQRTLDRRP